MGVTRKTNDPLRGVSTRSTPQTQQADPRQVRNSAGGYAFAADDHVRLNRFLTLGTTGGTYYTSEQKLTKDNAELVLRAARAGGVDLADRARDISVAGRAPRQNPALFALAAVAKLGDDDGRARALAHLPTVARTGSTLFAFLNYLQQFGGWGRGTRRAVAQWYLDKDPERLAYQLVKYRQRDGWTHRDVLRQAHPHALSEAQDVLFKYVVQEFDPNGEIVPESLPELVQAFELAQRATTVDGWTGLIGRYPLSWEMLPDAALTEPDVWRALLDHDRVPVGALLRQLPRLTRLGVLDSAPTRELVGDRITNADGLKRARIHPVNVLVAAKTYASGRGRGSSWTPNRRIVDLLDSAFYQAFGSVESTGGRMLVALDVSGSMSAGQAGGTPLTPREASSALALVQLATEAHADVVGFTGRGWTVPGASSRGLWGSGIEQLDITPRRRLDDVVRYTEGLPMGGTDCALPMLWATETRRDYDTFVIYTDSETWAGGQHPHQALRAYRERQVPGARLVVVGMTANDVSIADPTDPGQLDVAGFDSATPQLIGDFGGKRL